jgi:hypothetical protein
MSHRRSAVARWFRLCAVGLPFLGLTLAGVLQRIVAEEKPAPFTTEARPAVLLKGTLTGAFSCSSTTCHQRPGNPGDKGCEFTTWSSADPHRITYQDRALAGRIVKLFDQRPETAPVSDVFCLKCHGMSVARPAVLPACELCHGPAGGWLAQHYLKDWSTRSLAEKQELGFHATKNVRVRAEVCVDCHVGGPAQEVNHDLIAAGHPPLSFEFATYFARLPRHWSSQTDRELRSGSPVGDWSVGQLVSAEAALRLLASRADPRTVKPWPEFAEHDCRACHHDLRDRETKPARDNRFGAVPANRWYTAALEDRLAPLYPAADLGPLRKDLTNLRDLLARPLPPAKDVAGQARGAALKLKMILEKVPKEP